jgi:periplasmic copper chaperone A
MKKIIAAAAAAVLLLTGCSESEGNAIDGAIEVSNAYVRATDENSSMGGMLMTGAFMDIYNNTEESVSLVSAESDVAGLVEIHEVVDGVMRQKEGGIVIPSQETSVLKPGGNHVMLMDLMNGLVAGDEVRITLEFSNGDRVEVVAAVKVINLEQEHYDEDHSGM